MIRAVTSTTLTAFMWTGILAGMEQNNLAMSKTFTAHSRSSLPSTKDSSKKQFVDPTLLSTVVCAGGQRVLVSRRSFGLLDTMTRWQSTNSNQPIEISDMTADQLRLCQTLSYTLKSKDYSLLKQLSTEQLIDAAGNLESLMTPTTVMHEVCQELKRRYTRKPVTLKQETYDLINRYSKDTDSQLKTMIITGHIYNHGPVILDNRLINLKGLELTNLDGIEHLKDLKEIATEANGVHFGNISAQDIRTVDLSYNRLNKITAQDLRNIKKLFPNIDMLVLTNNDIRSLDLETLKEMEGQTIALDDNPLLFDLSLLDNTENVRLWLSNTPTAQTIRSHPNHETVFIENHQLDSCRHTPSFKKTLEKVLRTDLGSFLIATGMSLAHVYYCGLSDPYLIDKPIKSILNQIPLYQSDRYHKLFLLTMRDKLFFLFRCPAGVVIQYVIHVSSIDQRSRNLLSLLDPIGSTLKLPIELIIKQFYKRYGTPMIPSTAFATSANQNE